MSGGPARPVVECDECGEEMKYVLNGCIATWECSSCGHAEQEEETEPEDMTCPTCEGEKEKVMIDGEYRYECPPCWQKKIEDERRSRFGDPEAELKKALTSGGGIF